MNKLIALCLFLATTTLWSQEKMLTMRDAVLGGKTNLSPEKPSQLGWVPGTNQFVYISAEGADKALFMGKASDNKLSTQTVFTLSELNKKMLSLSNQQYKRFPRLNWTSSEELRFELNQNVYLYNLETQNLKHSDSLELPKGFANRDNAPQTDHIAFTQKNNLYVLASDKVIAVSNEEDLAIVSGQSVSRSEFGITKGTFWSPDGSLLAFYVKDETDVSEYPIVDWTEKPATVDMIKYPMAGTEGTERVYLKVYDVKSAKVITVKTGEPNTQYLTNISWSPDSRKIYIAHLNRDQNHMQWKSYDAETGELDRLLFEEKSDKYVEPLHALHFVAGAKDKFVWESSRSGHNHLYLYNTKGKLIRQLTKGDWDVTSFDGFNASGDKAFFTSTTMGAINRDFYELTLKDGKFKKLTTEVGTHSVKVNDAGNYFIDEFSNLRRPYDSWISGIESDVFFRIKEAVDPLEEYKLGNLSEVTLSDENGEPLYAHQYLPPGFDEKKKYPVIVYLYGGPHVQMVRNKWRSNLWFDYMAQQDYIVWVMDSRGSGNRGIAWEQNTFRQLGTVEMKDQLVGINYLKNKPYVDAERMGIHGWSFGGFMTMSMMSRNPGVFKAGVAGGPVIDWSYYEVMYTERYMDTPKENPEGYENSNLMNHVDDLEGDLLVIHGTSDPVVVWQHTQLYLKKAIESGKQLDYFVYPMHEHNVYGEERIHLMQKITDYFNDHL